MHLDGNSKHFFEQYTINPTQCTDLWNANNMLYLRNHFLYSPKDNLYLVLNYNLLVDKFYQGMRFDFFNSMIRHNGTIENGKRINNFETFNSLLGEKFSEKIMFYHLMRKTFDMQCDVLFEGERLKPFFGNGGEPDFYIRRGNKVLLFEFKDSILNDTVKFSADIEHIKKEVMDKICKGGKHNRKGGGQLLHCINAIVNEDTLSALDSEAKSADIFFPVVVTTDRSFSAGGINRMLIPEFVNISRQYQLAYTHICPMIILDYDTLFKISKQIHDGKLVLEDLIADYFRKFCKKDIMPSFYTYIYDRCRGNHITEDENLFLLGDFFRTL